MCPNFFLHLQLCDLLKSRVSCPNFLEKLECAQVSVPQSNTGMHYLSSMISLYCIPIMSNVSCPLNCLRNTFLLTEEGSSWDMVSENDLWEGGNVDLDEEDYVLVSEEDIVDGIACFMAAYLLSLKQTKVRNICFHVVFGFLNLNDYGRIWFSIYMSLVSF